MTELPINDVEPSVPQATRWSLVGRLEEGDDATRQQALNDLVQAYLPVLEWYLSRHRGLGHHQGEDLIQGFVASKVMHQNILTRADRSRGRFRTFLLNAFQNYIRDELRRASAARRTPPGGPPLPLEEADGVKAQDADMDRQFRQAWMRQVISMAVDGMEKECIAGERPDVWAVFRARLLDPILMGMEPEPYGVLTRRLQLESPSQASNLLITAKRMFSRHLRDVVRETVSDPSEAEEELHELEKCL
jgi:RNA polymerase sigma-70 factor (ECF subfamily)